MKKTLTLLLLVHLALTLSSESFHSETADRKTILPADSSFVNPLVIDSMFIELAPQPLIQSQEKGRFFEIYPDEIHIAEEKDDKIKLTRLPQCLGSTMGKEDGKFDRSWIHDDNLQIFEDHIVFNFNAQKAFYEMIINEENVAECNSIPKPLPVVFPPAYSLDGIYYYCQGMGENKIFSYDPTSDNTNELLQVKNVMPSVEGFRSFLSVNDDKVIYAITEQNSKSFILNVYDTEKKVSQEFRTKLPDLPEGFRVYKMVHQNEQIGFIGGTAEKDQKIMPQVFFLKYDLLKEKWNSLELNGLVKPMDRIGKFDFTFELVDNEALIGFTRQVMKGTQSLFVFEHELIAINLNTFSSEKLIEEKSSNFTFFSGNGKRFISKSKEIFPEHGGPARVIYKLYDRGK